MIPQSCRVLICGGVISTIFLLAASVAQSAPANDLFVNRTVITGTNITVSVNNTGAIMEPDELPGWPGGASVWWSWTAPYSGFVTIRTANNGLDTILALFTGSSLPNLTLISYNDDEDTYGGLANSYIYVDVKGGETYQICADGYMGVTGNIILSLKLQPFPLAPRWSLLDPYGNMISSSNYAGKVVLFNFWATWCGPCKAEMPDLVSLQEQYRDAGLVIVGVACGGDTPADVISFLGTFTPTINYQMVMSTAEVETAFGGIPAIPVTFIIDRGNHIRNKYVGTQSRETFESSILPLLAENKVAPGLTCDKINETSMYVRWPTNEPTCTLQWTLDLSNPSSWANWPTAPRVVNSSNRVQVSIAGKAKYFRLNMPY